MFLGNLSRDSIASSLLKTISTNNNGHKKTTPLKGSTKQTPTSCSTNTESLWNYSDVFGQEWEEGLGTAHRVFAEDRRTTPVTGLSQGKLREPNKEKPTKPSVPKKGSEGTTFAVENSPISRQKVGYTTERVSQKSSFKEELEAWRHRSVQSISSESKGFVREPLDITVVSKWPKKRGYNNDLAHRNDKKEAKKIDKESSEEEENRVLE
ncbi:uncharacterized protein Gasu_02080 [Galdieria sulphuraria]|uniref:Uncharacterized protein n=1 Tax=Galdieria sulphuraria TaxID=130081 RepID=M2XRK1_GALSU|nr:uncharacterized protein Gasu_02080 [Galdieria sulphuraria]EME32857.1 hypothetical protein Gasu_02080 [Galdieria sulphuraria]|eukprot:XP_005709377.1 hypothetical protein Gasu_02080 [Galdieria sulphuraria]